MLVYHPPKVVCCRVYRSGDKAINISYMTYLWWHHHHLQGKVIACWSPFLSNLVVIGLIEVEIKHQARCPYLDDVIISYNVGSVHADPPIKCGCYRSYTTGDEVTVCHEAYLLWRHHQPKHKVNAYWSTILQSLVVELKM